MTQYLFFSGKGGVGKTSMACATAVYHTHKGQRTLIVTTDPASNLADVFEQPIGHQIQPLKGFENLWAMEIDPDKATQEYKERAIAPLRDLFPASMIKVIEEQMSGPCTAEVAAFDRFTDFLGGNDSQKNSFDIVIFDTAPTGHTIRLLELPAEWSNAIETASQSNGQTCMGPAAAIQDSKVKYDLALSVLRDAQQTSFTFVLHPEAIAIRETKRSIHELGKLGIENFHLIVNGIIPQTETANPLFAARREMQSSYLTIIQKELPYPTRFMQLLDEEIKGFNPLDQVGRMLYEAFNPALSSHKAAYKPVEEVSSSPDIQQVLSRISPNGHHRIVFFAGKGGVGKTVVSCVSAVWLARQGHKTLLLTTDPAAHLGDVLDIPVGDEPQPMAQLANLWVAKIDPKTAAETYKARILEDARQQGRPAEAIRVMEEELDSPCTEEMAAFDRFIDFASQKSWDVIVFDTAPTGHTLRLLELPIDWSQQLDVKVFASVESSAADDVAKQRFSEVIDMMRDPSQSTMAFVMYPEATPILEAYRASQELKDLGIPTGLVVANFVIPAGAATTPFIQNRREMQVKYLENISDRFTAPVLRIPLQPQEVKGLAMIDVLASQIFEQRVSVGS